MNDKIIKTVNPIFTWVAVLLIQMTDFCNFSCKYCITWKKFTWKSIDIKSFNKIKELILKLKEKYAVVDITLTWWEPTLWKDFFEFLDKLLDLEVKVTINSNGFKLYEKQNQLSILSQNKNSNYLFFFITFHYKQYFKKTDLFISSLKLIKDFKFNYWVNFLLPDDASIQDFIFAKEYIVWLLDTKNYNFSLIKWTDWKISESYSKESLDYFYNNFDESDKIKNLEIVYLDWQKENVNSSELIYKWLNNFSWYKCNFLSKNYVNIYLETDLTCYFWSCYSLNRLRYTIDEIIDFFDKSLEKNIICWDHTCLCESDFNTKKSKIDNNLYIKDKLKSLFSKIKPNDFDITYLVIWNNSIQIILSQKDIFVFIILEKIIEKNVKYPFSDWKIGYHYYSKNKENEFINLESKNQNTINLFLKRVYIFNKIISKIII